MMKVVTLIDCGCIDDLDAKLSKWLNDKMSTGCTIVSCTWDDDYDNEDEVFNRTTHVVMDVPNDHPYR